MRYSQRDVDVTKNRRADKSRQGQPAAMAKQSFNEQVMKSFGSALRAAREAAGYKYAKTFAETLGVPDHRYRAWERGEYTPNLMMLTRMCRLLDVEPNTLLPLALKGASNKRAGSSDPRAAA